MAFEGFADDQAKFFRLLAKNQDRSWFQAHKAEFEAGWQAPMKELLGEVRAGTIGNASSNWDITVSGVAAITRTTGGKDTLSLVTQGAIGQTQGLTVTNLRAEGSGAIGDPSNFQR